MTCKVVSSGNLIEDTETKDNSGAKEVERGRKRQSNPEDTLIAKWKRRRNRGDSYSPRKKKGEPAKKKVPAREMLPTCPFTCRKKCSELLSEEQRFSIFKGFWNYGDHIKQQQQFVTNNIHVLDKKRKRPVTGEREEKGF